MEDDGNSRPYESPKSCSSGLNFPAEPHARTERNDVASPLSLTGSFDDDQPAASQQPSSQNTFFNNDTGLTSQDAAGLSTGDTMNWYSTGGVASMQMGSQVKPSRRSAASQLFTSSEEEAKNEMSNPPEKRGRYVKPVRADSGIGVAPKDKLRSNTPETRSESPAAAAGTNKATWRPAKQRKSTRGMSRRSKKPVDPMQSGHRKGSVPADSPFGKDYLENGPAKVSDSDPTRGDFFGTEMEKQYPEGKHAILDSASRSESSLYPRKPTKAPPKRVRTVSDKSLSEDDVSKSSNHAF
ncbi:hypothetical protein VTL71DRAFT_4499 [Oculimacula yallundae]|uniref:Uncharacterized protein n=1 Tax=Oculimacula yallundae TaxID=86028 RepID=A0ABR4C260_9HELO